MTVRGNAKKSLGETLARASLPTVAKFYSTSLDSLMKTKGFTTYPGLNMELRLKNLANHMSNIEL